MEDTWTCPVDFACRWQNIILLIFEANGCFPSYNSKVQWVSTELLVHRTSRFEYMHEAWQFFLLESA